jgi:hypothetical protein
MAKLQKFNIEPFCFLAFVYKKTNLLYNLFASCQVLKQNHFALLRFALFWYNPVRFASLIWISEITLFVLFLNSQI